MTKACGFQAVVLAGGKGSRMMDLTSSIPKCLLPVANLPMVWYPLAALEKAGFQSAIVMVSDKCRRDVSQLLSENCPKLEMSLEFVSVPEQEDWGTADALKHIADKIHSDDLLLISCDFISDFSLEKLLDEHRKKNATLTCLLSDSAIQGPTPGPKAKRKQERDLVAIEPKTNRLLLMGSDADFEEEIIPFSRAMITRYPNLKLQAKLCDCHVYLVKSWVLDLLRLKDDMFTVKGELVPFLLKKQYSRFKNLPQELKDKIKPGLLGLYAFNRSKNLENEEQADELDWIKCFAYVPSVEKGDVVKIVARCNTIGAYFEANKQTVKQLHELTNGKLRAGHSTSVCHAQIGNDCYINDGVCFGDKAQIKRTVVGKNCRIGERSKVVNSLLMDYVQIGDGAEVMNSIICHSGEVGEKGSLKDCLIATNQRVAGGRNLVSEVIGGESSGIMEI